jgi:hypothetical protein
MFYLAKISYRLIKEKRMFKNKKQETKSGKQCSESLLQSECFQYHWNNFPDQRGLLFHVQQKARNKIEGNRFKAMGVVSGVSDMIYLKPGGRPLLIEFKTETGTQSSTQKDWQQKVEAIGYEYVICRSFSHFQQLFLI